MEEASRRVRKTRFVCVSDTHNATPGGAFKLPKGDVLIHAGDMTNQGTFSELQKTVNWIEEANFECKIVIAGNHDITLDSKFYDQYGFWFHNQHPQDPEKCRKLLEDSPKIIYLKEKAARVKLTNPNGPRTSFKVFGSPFSPEFGTWAFYYDRDEATNVWDKIPLDSDIVITHGPPKYHCDESSRRKSVGCEALRNMLWRVRPRLAICGHIHDGRGSHIVQWDLDNPNIKYKEAGIIPWEDPGQDNNKMSLVDLTSRGGRPLVNDGSTGAQDAFEATAETPVTYSNASLPNEASRSATLGQGGIPPSGHCDLEALLGRTGRQETCIINASIMGSEYPHKGGKKFNKPIVIDIDLPLWETN